MQVLPTGVEGREMGRGSWVGFLGEEGGVRRFFFGADTKPFRGSVGVPAGEGVQERHVRAAPPADALQAEPEEDDEDELEEEDEETRSSTAARGSMSGGGGGGAALPC